MNRPIYWFWFSVVRIRIAFHEAPDGSPAYLFWKSIKDLLCLQLSWTESVCNVSFPQSVINVLCLMADIWTRSHLHCLVFVSHLLSFPAKHKIMSVLVNIIHSECGSTAVCEIGFIHKIPSGDVARWNTKTSISLGFEEFTSSRSERFKSLEFPIFRLRRAMNLFSTHTF
jgi:hypothetical protein